MNESASEFLFFASRLSARAPRREDGILRASLLASILLDPRHRVSALSMMWIHFSTSNWESIVMLARWHACFVQAICFPVKYMYRLIAETFYLFQTLHHGAPHVSFIVSGAFRFRCFPKILM
jgi:hypothetical protein